MPHRSTRGWRLAERRGITSTKHWHLQEYLLKKHPAGVPAQERPNSNSTTWWHRRGRRYLRIMLTHALKGAAYTIGATSVTWAIWWIQTQ